MTASLYIHIPFCTSASTATGGSATYGGKCDYCDFFSVPISESRNSALPDLYIDAVLDDIKEQLDLFDVDDVPTVYIGGGTPSALGAVRIKRLLAGIQAALKPLKTAPGEFTIEANPESADEDFLKACTAGGVNRISLGVQTFHKPSRTAVHRQGDGKLLEQRLALAAAYFPNALSVDLITGLPFQTGDILRQDIDRALQFGPVHVSLYSLILEPETPLGKRVSQFGANTLSLPCGDEADNLWILGRNMLEANSFAQYEVSNFCMPNKTCAHNIRYWRMENWLGIGPAASGTIINDETGCGRRYTYPHSIEAYLTAPAPRISFAGIEELDRGSLIRESLLMGFRYREGIDNSSFKRRFGCGLEDCIPATIARWRKRGFFETAESGDLKLSPNGMLFLNSFLRDAFEELD